MAFYFAIMILGFIVALRLTVMLLYLLMPFSPAVIAMTILFIPDLTVNVIMAA